VVRSFWLSFSSSSFATFRTDNLLVDIFGINFSFGLGSAFSLSSSSSSSVDFSLSSSVSPSLVGPACFRKLTGNLILEFSVSPSSASHSSSFCFWFFSFCRSSASSSSFCAFFLFVFSLLLLEPSSLSLLVTPGNVSSHMLHKH